MPGLGGGAGGSWWLAGKETFTSGMVVNRFSAWNPSRSVNSYKHGEMGTQRIETPLLFAAVRRFPNSTFVMNSELKKKSVTRRVRVELSSALWMFLFNPHPRRCSRRTILR